MDQGQLEQHAVIFRMLAKRGRSGLPIEEPEMNACRERHLSWFLAHGWTVVIRDSEMPPQTIDPAQSNPKRDDTED